MTERPFLGFGLWVDKRGETKIIVASKAIDAMKQRVREITKRSRGRSVQQVVVELRRYLLGWWGYFGITEGPGGLQKAMSWMRRRVRCLILYQFKNPWRTYDALKEIGGSELHIRVLAANVRRWWHNSGADANRVLTNAYLVKLGVPKLL